VGAESDNEPKGERTDEALRASIPSFLDALAASLLPALTQVQTPAARVGAALDSTLRAHYR